jgi:hypothetical protein
LSQSLDFVIITEGEFDAMIASQHGLPAVSSTGGANTFKSEWLELFNNIRHVYVCYDTDEAGIAGAARVASLFGNKAKIVHLPSTEGGKVDLTDYFTRLEKTVEDFGLLLKSASAPTVQEEPTQQQKIIHGFTLNNSNGSAYELEKDGLVYQVKLQRKKDTIILAVYKRGELIHQDNLNLHSDRRRNQFSERLAELSEEERGVFAKNLLSLSLVIDKLSHAPIKPVIEPEKPLNANEITEANQLLNSPLLLHKILQEAKKLVLLVKSAMCVTPLFSIDFKNY